MKIFDRLNPFLLKSSTNHKEKNIQINRGHSYAPVEITRNFLAAPVKMLLLNPNYASGNISEETISKVKEYLEKNELFDVAVCVNDYDPEFLLKRTLTNPQTSSIYKYTIGLYTWGFVSLLCPKLTALVGDHYNGASNTIHLFSNDLSIALHECGHAKDFNLRQNRDLYSVTSLIPFVSPFSTLYKEYQANWHVRDYLYFKKNDREAMKEACITLTPAFSSYIGGAFVYFARKGYLNKSYAGMPTIIKAMIVGHIAGHGLANICESNTIYQK